MVVLEGWPKTRQRISSISGVPHWHSLVMARGNKKGPVFRPGQSINRTRMGLGGTSRASHPSHGRTTCPRDPQRILEVEHANGPRAFADVPDADRPIDATTGENMLHGRTPGQREKGAGVASQGVRVGSGTKVHQPDGRVLGRTRHE